jgi:hypothetical protein
LASRTSRTQLCPQVFANWQESLPTLFPGAAEIPALPIGFAGLNVPTRVLSPTLPQQLDMHFLKMNNTLSREPLYFLFFGASLPIGLSACNLEDRFGTLFWQEPLSFLYFYQRIPTGSKSRQVCLNKSKLLCRCQRLL